VRLVETVGLPAGRLWDLKKLAPRKVVGELGAACSACIIGHYVLVLVQQRRSPYLPKQIL